MFNPIGKSFAFKLDEYDCYKCATGMCSLEGISLQELRSLDYTHITGESDIRYCRGIAKMYLDGDFTATARLTLNTLCSHYEFSDGQHRTCVNSKLLKKGSDLMLNVELKTQNNLCRNCLVHNDFNSRYKEFSIIDRIFKTTKYKILKSEMITYKKSEFIEIL